MNKYELKRQIMQTLLRGHLVEIKDSKEKSHILGIGYCENLNLINYYIEQLNYDDIVCMIQENEESNLFIETNKRLKMEIAEQIVNDLKLEEKINELVHSELYERSENNESTNS